MTNRLRSLRTIAELRAFTARHRAPLIAAAVAVILRLAAQVALGFYDGPSAFEEDAVARNIVEGRGYVYELNGAPTYALRAPAYALLLAGIYGLFGIGSLPAGLAQAALGALLGLLTYAVGRRVATPRIGAIAALAVAADPALLVYSARIHPINLDAVLFLAGVFLMLRIRDVHSALADHVSLGLVAGVTVLSRPTFVPALLLTTFIVGLRRSLPHDRTIAIRTLVVVAVAFAVVAPWSLRNLSVVATPALTSSTGLTLWLGNNPMASGGTVTPEGISILDAVPAVRDSIWGKNEFEQDAILTREAIAYMASDPGRTARAYAAKFVSFWWFAPQTGVLYPRSWLPIAVAFQSLLLILGAIGVVALVRQRQHWALWVMASAIVLAAATQAVFYVDGRHRYACEPVLLIVGVIGLAQIGSALRPGALLPRDARPPRSQHRRSLGDG